MISGWGSVEKSLILSCVDFLVKGTAEGSRHKDYTLGCLYKKAIMFLKITKKLATT